MTYKNYWLFCTIISRGGIKQCDRHVSVYVDNQVYIILLIISNKHQYSYHNIVSTSIIVLKKIEFEKQLNGFPPVKLKALVDFNKKTLCLKFKQFIFLS